MSDKSILKTTTIGNQEQKSIEQSPSSISQKEQVILALQKSNSVFVKFSLQNTDQMKRMTLNVKYKYDLPFNCLKNKVKTQGFRIYRKIKKNKKKNSSDYRKNICGYITKKVMKQFVSSNYHEKVRTLCFDNNCDINQAKNYYYSKVERDTGPSHIPELITPANPAEYNFKYAFTQFFQWFLNERYLRYLLIQGKMADKKAYIDYKNLQLSPFITNKKIQLKQAASYWLKQQQKFVSKSQKRTKIEIPIAIKPLKKQPQTY